MELLDFRKEFLESVKVASATSDDGTVAMFVREAADALLDAGVIGDYELSFYTGTGRRNRRLRVDGYSYDDYDMTMTLLIADYNGGEKPRTLTLTNANQLFGWLRSFLDEALGETLANRIEISTPAYDLLDLINTHRRRIRKYRFILLTDNLMSERIDRLPLGEVNGLPIEHHIWDISRIHRVCSDGGREELEIDITRYAAEGIPVLEAGAASTEEYRSFLCVLPGNVLADIYDEYGSRLLEGNVRSFLSTKVAVNRKIRTTILSQPYRFFAYNNGISATATDVVLEDTDSGKYLTYVKGFQIVNGGQTTASLSTARYRDNANLSSIYVQMKLTEVESSLAEHIIPEISRSSNSQNKVSEADFFSNHAFHIRMESISRRLFAPATGGAQHETHWFYERARGQYMQQQARLSRGQKSRFLLQNPKSQLVTKTDFAKVHNSWKGFPHKVSLGAQKNFVEFAQWITEEWDKEDNAFNESFFRDSISLVILYRHTEKLVSRQPWYDKGYRANIVAYSIAFLAHLLRKQYKDRGLDLQLIWNKQTVPDVLDQQMAFISKAVFDVLTDEERPVQNVTEWSKRELCWNRTKGLNVTLMPELESIMTSLDEVRSSAKNARREQAVITGIEAQMFVVSLGQQYWMKLLEWARGKKLLSQEDIKLLVLAGQMSSNRLPNAVQCRKLQELRNRLLSEGYQEPLG